VKKGEAEFIASAGSKRDFPIEGSPEIALAGRSNVGKSSLINRLAHKKIARTGSEPGTTQSINFYRIQDSFVFVDLPGYGFAKAAKTKKEEWRRLVEDYFSNRKAIALVIHLVDARLGPTPLDVQLQRWLDRLRAPRLLVATKADKLSGNSRASQERILSSAFCRPVVMCSAVTGTGCEEVWNQILDSAQQIVHRSSYSQAS
jgi:GTP-binding protein